MTDRIDAFFAFARERHAIYLRKRAGSLPLTQDPILSSYRFTNVFRQLDKTTQWYTENVRLELPPEQMLLATVVYRWFNRIRTGEAIFQNHGLRPSGGSIWDKFEQYNTDEWLHAMKTAIIAHCGLGPYVTGAYIIKTPDGMNKLDGVLQCIRWFMEGDWREYNLTPESKPQPLEDTWRWLKTFPFMGDFMAYEVVTDLRWCTWWDKAPDIMTWANPGPGATRGIGRVFENNKDRYNQHRDKEKILIPAMKILLDASKDAGNWPQSLGNYDGNCNGQQCAVCQDDPDCHHEYSRNCEYDERFQKPGDWPAWEMRDVEHTLCEFDKYERVRTGEGRPRGTYP